MAKKEEIKAPEVSTPEVNTPEWSWSRRWPR